MIVKRLEDLEAYQLAGELAVVVYRLVKKLPDYEKYCLKDQLCRAVVSVGSNIAEGFGRYHFKDKNIFFYNARGSLFEVKFQLSLCYKLGYISENETNKVISEIDILAVKLNNLISSITNNNK